MKVSFGIACVLLFTSSLAVAEPERLLTMRSADRAIDLGFQSELSNDFAGERDALERLVRSATASEESAGRQLLLAWMEGAQRREESFRAHGRSARAYFEAHQTLREFGIKRSEQLWNKARHDLPELASASTASSSVHLRIDFTRPSMNSEDVLKILAEEIERHGIRVGVGKKKDSRPAFDVRIVVEASDVETSERGVRVTASASAVVRRYGIASDALGSVYKRRTERRRVHTEARSFATRRVLIDLASGIVFQVRSELLGSIRDRSKTTSTRT